MKQNLLKLVADGLYKEAIALYAKLHSASIPPHRFTFPPLFKACSELKLRLQGQILHTHLFKTGFHSDAYTATALTGMYMKLNLFRDALKVLAEMPDPNLPSFNAVISGFSKNGCLMEAVLLFREMVSRGFLPNSVTIASFLPACDTAWHCLQMHCWVVKLGMEIDIYVATSLVTVYSNCGEMIMAANVFSEMHSKNVVSYNAFMSGLLQNGVPSVVLNVFKDMREGSTAKPDSCTLLSVISACANLLYLQFGRQVHGLILKSVLEYDALVGTALVDMYSKCGCWQWAYNVFNDLKGRRNLITWNSMIAGMMLNEQSEKAVELFSLLESEGLKPDSATWNSMISGFAQLENGIGAFTFFQKMQSDGTVPSLKCVTSLLPACASLSALQSGKEIHGHAIRTDIDTDEFMATALIDMYMKCGCPSWARKIFDQFQSKPRDPAFWNAMISGYGRNGQDESVFQIFVQMLEEKVEPNLAAFTSVLSVCSRAGEVNKGRQIFRMMTRDYGLNTKPEHFRCIVDLLGRSGLLDEARKLIQDMQEPCQLIFASLLDACKHHLNSDLGEEMALKLLEIEPMDPTPLTILSDIFVGLGWLEEVERVRQMINERGLRRSP